VLSLISQGATNREIANSLTIAENTVKVHLRRILDKLDLRNRQQAAAYAVQEGITEVVIDTSLSNQPR
jgi:two-component system, NarL family, nitrate/nitrite response regulator NarL